MMQYNLGCSKDKMTFEDNFKYPIISFDMYRNIKVSGPRVHTFYIEKNSHMDAI